MLFAVKHQFSEFFTISIIKSHVQLFRNLGDFFETSDRLYSIVIIKENFEACWRGQVEMTENGKLATLARVDTFSWLLKSKH